MSVCSLRAYHLDTAELGTPPDCKDAKGRDQRQTIQTAVYEDKSLWLRRPLLIKELRVQLKLEKKWVGVEFVPTLPSLL